MKARLTILCTIFVGLTHLLHAQDTSEAFKFELSGRMGYSYIDLTQPSSIPGMADYSVKSHSVSLSPAVGYFASSNIELLSELAYTFTTSSSMAYSFPGPLPLTMHEVTTTSHQIGIGLGVAYNLRVNSAVIIYGGTMIRLSWQHFAEDPENFAIGSRWLMPSATIPILFGGAKVFVAPSWSIIAQLEYDHQSNAGGVSNVNVNTVFFSAGFAVYL